MRTCLLLTAALGAGLFEPGVAHAEPIASITTKLIVADGQTEFYLGSGYLADYSTGELQEVHKFNELPAVMGGMIYLDREEVRIAGQSKESYRFGSEAPLPGSPNRTNDFILEVTLTDHASGESGVLQFLGRSDLNDVLPWDLRGESMLLVEGLGALTLGGRRYDLEVGNGPSDSAWWVYADVSVSAATPEPTTLAMAGMGLAALVSRRRFLRSLLPGDRS